MALPLVFFPWFLSLAYSTRARQTRIIRRCRCLLSCTPIINDNFIYLLFTDRRDVPEYRQGGNKIRTGSQPREQRRHHQLTTANVRVNIP